MYHSENRSPQKHDLSWRQHNTTEPRGAARTWNTKEPNNRNEQTPTRTRNVSEPFWEVSLVERPFLTYSTGSLWPIIRCNHVIMQEVVTVWTCRNQQQWSTTHQDQSENTHTQISVEDPAWRTIVTNDGASKFLHHPWETTTTLHKNLRVCSISQ